MTASAPWSRMLPLSLGLVGCAGGPVNVTASDTATTGDSTSTTSTASASSTTQATTSASATTTITTTTITTTTTTTTTATTAVETTTSSTSDGTTTASSTTGPVEPCGPTCDETWVHAGDLTIDDQPADYTCLTRIVGDLYVAPDADPATAATLANLQIVDEELTLAGPVGLADLSTYACLREVKELAISGLGELADLSALQGLHHARRIRLQGLSVTALPTLAPDFAGIERLTLVSNPALVDLSAASSWTVGDPELWVEIFSCPALTDLSGLAGLFADNGGAPQEIHLNDLKG